MANRILAQGIVGSAITGNAASTDIVLYTVHVGHSARARVAVIAQAVDGTTAEWDLKAVLKNVAGVNTLIGSVLNIVSPQKELGATTWTATITYANGQIAVTVTGQLATTITWFVSADIMELQV